MDVNDLYDLLKFVVLYLAIGIVAAFIAVGLLVWFFKREKIQRP